MAPIAQLMRGIMCDDTEKYTEMMGTLNIVLKGDVKQFTGKPTTKRSMQIWTSAADTLLVVIVMRLRRSITSRICTWVSWTTLQLTRFERATRMVP